MAFTVAGVTLAEPGLRVLVSASGGTVQVVARGVSGVSNGVLVCPVEGAAGAPREGDCVVVENGRAVDLAVGVTSPGVLVRTPEGARGAPPRVAELTLIYVPDGDRITVLTPPTAPPQTPGDCHAGPCQTTFELSPTGSGTFVLEADGRGGRAQLTLDAGAPSGRSQVLSIVEGGGRLAIRSTLDGRSDARLTLRNQGETELPPLELTLSWPVRP